MTIWFPLGFALLVTFVVAVVLKRRGKPLRLSLFFFAGMPTGPSGMPGLAWMFPGTGTPPDPDPRAAISGPPNPHETSSLPAGVSMRARADTTDD